MTNTCNRRFFTHIAALGALGLLAGCGGKKSGAAPLRVGMELSTPPFEMADAQGRPDGVSVRMAEALAAKLGRPLQIEVMAFKGLETALKTGSIDVILSSMTDTPKRRESISFSDAYCRIGLALLVPASSQIKDAAELDQPGRKIVVRLGTTAAELARTRFPKAEIIMLDQNPACLLEITQGKADAFIYDQLSILKMQAAQPAATRALLAPLQTESWAMAVAKDAEPLRTQINGFLAEFRASGGLDRLAEKYLAAERAAMKAQGVAFIFE
jgi:polar amino acid transport system substrate-binding protein